MKEKFKLSDFAEKYGLKTGNHCCYGVFGGYRVHVKYRAMANPACLITVVTDTKGRDKDLEKYLEKNKKELKLTNYGVVGIGLMVSPQLYMNIFSQIEKILGKITSHLKKAGYPGAEVCPYCGTEMQDGGIGMVESGIPFRAHEACYERALEAAVKREEEQLAAPAKKLAGTGGCLLGALVGAAAFVLMFMWWNFAAIGSAVGVLLAGYFYGRFGGKNTPYKVAACTLFPLLFALAAFAGCLLIGAGGGAAVAEKLAAGGEYRTQFLLNLIFVFVLDFVAAAYVLFSYLRSRKKISANMRRTNEV